MQAQALVATTPLPTFAWLRGRGFDLSYIVGIAVGAIALALAAVFEPRLFPIILIADLWLLGYHHVISTYTRVAFDRDSLAQHRFLVLVLPFLVLATTTTLALSIGAWILPTVYLYWQWLHYTRQSYGIAQIYRRKAGMANDERFSLHKGVIYVLPLWGILYRSAQAPETFLGMPIKVIPVNLMVADAVGVVALAILAAWVWQQAMAWREGKLAGAYALYMLSHVAVFATGYVLIDDINYGWLAINIWHNSQYIGLVWMSNTNRFKAGVDPKAKLISWMSQPRNWLAYFLICFGVSSALYIAISLGLAIFGLTAITFALIAYQTLNFHHYIVDSLIWKVRRPKLQAQLGLGGSR
jgi:hypothetical protein